MFEFKIHAKNGKIQNKKAKMKKGGKTKKKAKMHVQFQKICKTCKKMQEKGAKMNAKKGAKRHGGIFY